MIFVSAGASSCYGVCEYKDSRCCLAPKSRRCADELWSLPSTAVPRHSRSLFACAPNRCARTDARTGEKKASCLSSCCPLLEDRPGPTIDAAVTLDSVRAPALSSPPTRLGTRALGEREREKRHPSGIVRQTHSSVAGPRTRTTGWLRRWPVMRTGQPRRGAKSRSELAARRRGRTRGLAGGVGSRRKPIWDGGPCSTCRWRSP